MLQLVFSLFCVLCFSSGALAAAAVNCTSCHEKGTAGEKLSRYVHQPFLRDACGQCHIVGEQVEAPRKPSAFRAEQQQREKIRWFPTLSAIDDEHWVQLPREKARKLFVRASDGNNRSPLRKLNLPAVSTLPKLREDHKPPAISGLAVSDIRRGIGVTVVLKWRTDEFTSSAVYYGTGSPDSVKYAPELTRRHALTLDGLDADKTYLYQVVARDVFGNTTKSEVMTFTTDRSYISSAPRRDSNPRLSKQLKLDYQAYRVDGEYLLVFTADRPVSLSLGMENVEQSKNTVERKVESKDNFSHPILKSAFDTNIKVCKECHLQLVDGYSHPVNVKPRMGMEVPTEYRLLPDGRISCMSCHANHASDNAYRLLKASKEDLCRGCHSNY